MEIAALILSAIAISVSIWSARKSNQTARKQITLQERTLYLEEAEAQRRSKASKSADLRVSIARDKYSSKLLIFNEGEAGARDISLRINGAPLLEHPIVLGNQAEVKMLGPGAQARYIIEPTSAGGSVVRLELDWADDSGEPKNWKSELSLL